MSTTTGPVSRSPPQNAGFADLPTLQLPPAYTEHQQNAPALSVPTRGPTEVPPPHQAHSASPSSILTPPPSSAIPANAASPTLNTRTANPGASPSSRLPHPNRLPPSPVPSSAASTPSIRDFAHPFSSPQHTSPSPSLEPSQNRARRRLPHLSLGDAAASPDALPPYTPAQGSCMRYPTVFRSEDDYLKALSAWAQEKLYMDSPKDTQGTSVGVSGFYGEMRGEDYVRREEARKKDSGAGKGKRRGSRSSLAAEARGFGGDASGGRTSERPEAPLREKAAVSANVTEGQEHEDATATDRGAGSSRDNRKKGSLAQWMRKKRGGEDS